MRGETQEGREAGRHRVLGAAEELNRASTPARAWRRRAAAASEAAGRVAGGTMCLERGSGAARCPRGRGGGCPHPEDRGRGCGWAAAPDLKEAAAGEGLEARRRTLQRQAAAAGCPLCDQSQLLLAGPASRQARTGDVVRGGRVDVGHASGRRVRVCRQAASGEGPSAGGGGEAVAADGGERPQGQAAARQYGRLGCEPDRAQGGACRRQGGESSSRRGAAAPAGQGSARLQHGRRGARRGVSKGRGNEGRSRESAVMRASAAKCRPLM